MASVVIQGAGYGAVADKDGIFEIVAPDKAKVLQVTCVGYEKKLVPVKKSQFNTYVVYMTPATTELQEVVVHRRKYSKKNNPAVDFLNRLKDRAPLTDPRRNPYYSYDRYERLTLGINDFDAETRSGLARAIDNIEEHIDTSEISGKPFLSLLVKEKFSRQNYRLNPESSREVVTGLRDDGFDEFFDPSQMRIFFEDVMREIDLYANDINIFQNRFVSPLSRIAPDFYKFYLTDTVMIENERCIVLSFYPHNHSSFGFMGNVYVPENDSTMFIKRVEMHLPREINLNFIRDLYIAQDYVKGPDGSRLKVHDDMIAEMSIIAGSTGMYLSRRSAYANHSFDVIPDSVFAGGGASVVVSEAKSRDNDFWEHARYVGIGRGESKVGELLRKFREKPLYYWCEKIARVLFQGYIPTASPSKFDIGPVNSMLSFNSVEGTRLRFGGMTTSALSPRWFSRIYGAYGINDHKWKYGLEVEYSFIDKEYHSREFPVKALRLTSSYDIDRPGQSYMFTTPDNFVLSLKRMSDDRIIYKRLNQLQYILETRYDFSLGVNIANIRREAAPCMPFVDGYGRQYDHLNENSIELTLRYAPGEKFFQTRSYRLPVNLDAPAITLRHLYAPKGLGGTRYGVNVTEIDIAKRWWFSAFGYLDTYFDAGHVWGKTSFLNLLVPNANLSYIIQPRSFALLNPMEFFNTTYASFDITYWANGALFNFIPYLKDLKLREVFAFRGIWGHLNKKNNPAYDPSLLQFPDNTGLTNLGDTPYMEASVGVENIFKVLRVDYVWRLNYRNVPYEIDKSGIRIAVHVTF